MSIKLILEVLDSAPVDLTPTQRLVLVVIAERANDETREAWPVSKPGNEWGLSTIAMRVGVKPESVRKIFNELARRDPPIEVRVPIGQNRNGDPIFAHDGCQTTYRIPDLRQRADCGPPSGDQQGGPQSALWTPERADHNPPEGGPESREGGPPFALIPQVPSEEPSGISSSSGRASARARIAGVTGATDDEINLIIKEIRGSATQSIRNLAAFRRHAASLPRCRHEIAGGWHPGPDGLPLACADCRRWASDHPDGYRQRLAEVEATGAYPDDQQSENRPEMVSERPEVPRATRDTRRTVLGAQRPAGPAARDSPVGMGSILSDPEPSKRPSVRPGIGICVVCAENGQFVVAVDETTGSHCKIHQSDLLPPHD